MKDFWCGSREDHVGHEHLGNTCNGVHDGDYLKDGVTPEIFEEFVTLRERNNICAPLVHRFPHPATQGEITCQCGDLTVIYRGDHITGTLRNADPIHFLPGAFSIRDH